MKKAVLTMSCLALVSCLAGVSCGVASKEDRPGVPLSFSETGLPVVQVMVGDAEIPFVLDTGANCCLIDAATANGLRLPPVCPNTSHTTALLGGTVKLTHVHDVPVTVGGRDFVLKRLQIGDFPACDAHDIRGLFGMDFLRSARAVIDIEGARLFLSPGGGDKGGRE